MVDAGLNDSGRRAIGGNLGRDSESASWSAARLGGGVLGVEGAELEGDGDDLGAGMSECERLWRFFFLGAGQSPNQRSTGALGDGLCIRASSSWGSSSCIVLFGDFEKNLSMPNDMKVVSVTVVEMLDGSLKLGSARVSAMGDCFVVVGCDMRCS